MRYNDSAVTISSLRVIRRNGTLGCLTNGIRGVLMPTSVTQLEQALTAGSLKLDVAQLARLDEIFPPMGPAPEAYAW